MPPETPPPAASPPPRVETPDRPFFNLTGKAIERGGWQTLLTIPAAATLDITVGTTNKLWQWGKSAGIGIGKLGAGAAVLGFKGGKVTAERFLQYIYDGTVKVVTPGLKAAVDTAIISGHTVLRLPVDALKLATTTPINTVVGTTRAGIAAALMLGSPFSQWFKDNADAQWAGAKQNYARAVDLNLIKNTGLLAKDVYFSGIDTGANFVKPPFTAIGADRVTAGIENTRNSLKRPIWTNIFMSQQDMKSKLLTDGIAANDNAVMDKAA